MSLLHGTEDPPGEGMVVEVHLDMIDAPPVFLERMQALGFEDDPFLDFYPPQYRFHYTGRTRALPRDMATVLPPVQALVVQVLEEARAAGVALYVESELVRGIEHIPQERPRSMAALDGLSFAENLTGATAKADVHVEFRSGTVPGDVRELLIDKGFYWVSTPASEKFPPEEIATLQPSTFADARGVYERLQRYPLPGCTGIHLEQKLGMVPSLPDLPLPPVTDVALPRPEQQA